jgi:hypothetical protein
MTAAGAVREIAAGGERHTRMVCSYQWTAYEREMD